MSNALAVARRFNGNHKPKLAGKEFNDSSSLTVVNILVFCAGEGSSMFLRNVGNMVS